MLEVKSISDAYYWFMNSYHEYVSGLKDLYVTQCSNMSESRLAQYFTTKRILVNTYKDSDEDNFPKIRVAFDPVDNVSDFSKEQYINESFFLKVFKWEAPLLFDKCNIVNKHASQIDFQSASDAVNRLRNYLAHNKLSTLSILPNKAVSMSVDPYLIKTYILYDEKEFNENHHFRTIVTCLYLVINLKTEINNLKVRKTL